jgi:hypothetical protein
MPFCFVTIEDEDSPAASAVASLNIVKDIANHPALTQVHTVLECGTSEEARGRLAASTPDRVALNLAVRMMRTVMKTGQRHTDLG